ncbi:MULTISPECIES: hypothetical protein [unclassified Janthinobacterium]|uniref:hypothetical protein n=1 Tax=unclassified Janthinobacterium TaxID=2610881 RepID=UPI00182D7E2F|nr:MULTISPECIES: hypothetical protein [unclassified Janthinobacterium]MBB5371663.1 hypothetical protein [Janthinobacterium sp. K2C7]MBB5384468.1 hypothetical protein [Janthinobacterium sp. K2Li3]MBB5389744.1 hypothetical protein [Janthinobacterium sp. K2E3]
MKETHGGRVFNFRDLIQVKRYKEFNLVPILQDSQEALLFCLIHDDQYFVKRARIVKRMRLICFAVSPIARPLLQKKCNGAMKKSQVATSHLAFL